MQVKIQAILVETSEEVRLQLVQLMHSILMKAPRLIQPFASDVASILVAATFDTHPEVLLETFSTLEQFGELMGYKLKPVGEQLVRVVQVSLSHNHYRVRVAALKAIRRSLLAGFQDPSPHLRELAFKLMEEVGLQYEEENEKEVKDTRTYLTEDIDDIVSLAGAPLPHPFTCLFS
ncbi:unnamed protein product [Sphagnum balticum]